MQGRDVRKIPFCEDYCDSKGDFHPVVFHSQFRNQYDNDVTVWSPQVSRLFPLVKHSFVREETRVCPFLLLQGRIHQIEYAMEAVKQGSATVGLKSKTHAVLVALKVGLDPRSRAKRFQVTPPHCCCPLQRAQSELAAHQKKILHVDNHIGISIAGLTADARLLWWVSALSLGLTSSCPSHPSLLAVTSCVRSAWTPGSSSTGPSLRPAWCLSSAAVSFRPSDT